MKDKEKQIEEMAKVNCEKCSFCDDCDRCKFAWHEDCEKIKIATAIYNAGYRKIENSVVLSKEEAERFRGQTINIAKVKAQASKEMAEKILITAIQLSDMCKDFYEFQNRLVDLIEVNYGVKVERKTIIPAAKGDKEVREQAEKELKDGN